MIFAWIGALLIGISLGLLGSGGSILTVPVLVYLVGEPGKVAIAESLAIVGAISLFGAIPYIRYRSVDWRSVLLFGAPGMAGTYLGAFLSQFLSSEIQLALFALVMLMASAMMIGGRKLDAETVVRRDWWKIVLEGLAVGILTGLVGVGGGFLIVPALVLLGGLPMHLAIGSSLLIIALKSFAGFVKYLDVLAASADSVNWTLILVFTLIGILGSLFGARIGKGLSHTTLRRGFGFFLILMGIGILAENVWRLF